MRSPMAIQACFLASALSFWSVLTPGAMPHGVADPHWADPAEVCEPTFWEAPVSVSAFSLMRGAAADPGSDEPRFADPMVDVSIEQSLPAPLIFTPRVAQADPLPAFETSVESTSIGRPNFGPTAIETPAL